MKSLLNIGIDLGSDTIKIAYAYSSPNGGIEYGKFDANFLQAGMPAQAYYDSDGNGKEGKWLFANEIDESGKDSFVKIVKIKKLISLLAAITHHKDIQSSNREYYHSKNVFPRFYFPERRRSENDYEDMAALERMDRTFSVAGSTPKQVCEDFFRHIKNFVYNKIDLLEKQSGVTFDRNQIRYALVYPSKVGAEYIAELKRLVKLAFGKEVYKHLNSTRALAMYAYHEGRLKPGESALIFDMGEEDISVAKASIIKAYGKNSQDKVTVDGVDGHNDPQGVGGNDIDEAIAAFVDERISGCKTIGNTDEEVIYSKQYDRMKDIKCLKVLMSSVDCDELFPSGVPIWTKKEVSICYNFTKTDLDTCILNRKKKWSDGKEESVAARILEYILTETKRPVNRGVKRLYLSGGLAECDSLVDYLKREIEMGTSYRVDTFDFRAESVIARGEFEFDKTEDGVYASALGGAVTALKDWNVDVTFVYSYGTLGFHYTTDKPKKRKIFDIIGDNGMGDVIVEGKQKFMCDGANYNLEVEKYKSGENWYGIYAALITRSEIRNRNSSRLLGHRSVNDSGYFEHDGKWELCVPTEDVRGSLKMLDSGICELLDIHQVGSKAGEIEFYYNGERIVLMEQVAGTDCLKYKPGFYIDLDGRAICFISNETPPNIRVKIKYMLDGREAVIYGNDIEFKVDQDFDVPM